LLVLLSSFAPVVDKEAELKSILTKVVNDKNLVFFLDRYTDGGQVLLYRYEELPVYNSLPLPKPRFDLPYKKGGVVKFNLNMQLEQKNPVLIIESIIITQNVAKVHFRVPFGGIFGEYVLRKAKEWVIVSADISET
jgi:hypothetical protein